MSRHVKAPATASGDASESGDAGGGGGLEQNHLVKNTRPLYTVEHKTTNGAANTKFWRHRNGEMSEAQKAYHHYNASKSESSVVKRDPASPLLDEQPYKRARQNASTPNSDPGQLPILYKMDRSTDVMTLGKEASPRTNIKFDQSRFEPIEPVNNVAQPRIQLNEPIYISSNSDDGTDHDGGADSENEDGSEDEPLAAGRSRRLKHTDVSASGHQEEKIPRVEEPSEQPSSAHKTPIAIKKSSRCYTEPLPSAGHKRPRLSHVSETDSERSTNAQNNKDGQGSTNSAGFDRRPQHVPNYATRASGNTSSRSCEPELQQLANPQELPQNDKAVSSSLTDSHLDKEKQELQSKLRQQATEIKVLTQQLNSSQDIVREEMQSKQAKEDEIMALKKTKNELNQEVKRLLLVQLNQVTNSHELSNDASNEMAVEKAVSMSLRKRVTELEKAVDDKTESSKRLEGTLDYVYRQLESNKKAAAKEMVQEQKRAAEQAAKANSEHVSLSKTVCELETSLDQEKTRYRQLMKSNHEDVQDNIAKSQALEKQMREQTEKHQSQVKELTRKLDESAEKSSADDATTKRVEELEQQAKSQIAEIKGCHTKIVDLTNEVRWNEDILEEFRDAWHQRDLQEQRWKSDLRAIMNNELASLSDRSKAAIAAPDVKKRAAPKGIETSTPEVIERAASKGVEAAAQAEGSQGTSASLEGPSANGSNMASH
ncbi:hypothetical protein Daus18300_005509 [Diaporthe australafricana]|uniref:Uncharacterized protein n=1 Tax=Diaporthe australafricana TaxID=127596 RepID=A0ABR3X1H8_9PEZI